MYRARAQNASVPGTSSRERGAAFVTRVGVARTRKRATVNAATSFHARPVAWSVTMVPDLSEQEEATDMGTPQDDSTRAGEVKRRDGEMDYYYY